MNKTMTNPHITFKYGKAYAVDMPEKPLRSSKYAVQGQIIPNPYEASVEEAIEKGVLFEDQDEIARHVYDIRVINNPQLFTSDQRSHSTLSQKATE